MFKSIPKTNDDQLIDWIKQGNKAMDKAITYILAQQGEKIKGYILGQSGSIEEAEDALYEGLAAFIQNVRKGSFNGESTIATYLTSICKGIWYKKFKRMMIHKKWEDAEIGSQTSIYEDTVLSKELKKGLNILMSSLKDKCKDVLNLWSLSYSMTEIAEKLDYKSSQTAMNKKNLCLKELRSQLHNNPNLAELIV